MIALAPARSASGLGKPGLGSACVTAVYVAAPQHAGRVNGFELGRCWELPHRFLGSCFESPPAPLPALRPYSAKSPVDRAGTGVRPYDQREPLLLGQAQTG